MRQLTLVGPGQLEWWDVPQPRIEAPGQAIVQPIVVATCDLDAAMLRQQAPIRGPLALGHEFVAEVVETGDEVRQLALGQRVVVPYEISCGTCAFCRRGFTANCASVPRTSMYGLGAIGGNWGGALSDLVCVPFADHMLVPVPEGIPPTAIASAGDNISDAWRTVGPYLEETPGAAVLIVGGASAGSIGLYAAGIAHALGATRVDYLDQDAGRLEIAQALGANPIAGPAPRRLGPYPITVDASANLEGLACALRSTEPEGVCTSTGIYYKSETPIPLFDMYNTGVTFKTGRCSARATIPRVLDLVRDGRLHPELVTTHVAPWDEAADALLDFGTKLVITRDASGSRHA